MTPPWKVAWVTGASTGIGREIALTLARQGITVAASARDGVKLSDLGHGIRAYPLDVTDAVAVAAVVEQIEAELGPIDLTVLGAGIYRPLDVGLFPVKQFHDTMNTNYMGVINALAAILPRMIVRRHGHVSWIASVAGIIGLPKAAAYGPTKSALINLGESLAPELLEKGVAVSVICPGFVATPLTAQNDFSMPFLMMAPEAARRTVEGLRRRKFEISYPTRFVLILKVARLLPHSVYFWLVRRFVLKSPT